jgi:hypothetical protein
LQADGFDAPGPLRRRTARQSARRLPSRFRRPGPCNTARHGPGPVCLLTLQQATLDDARRSSAIGSMAGQGLRCAATEKLPARDAALRSKPGRPGLAVSPGRSADSSPADDARLIQRLAGGRADAYRGSSRDARGEGEPNERQRQTQTNVETWRLCFGVKLIRHRRPSQQQRAARDHPSSSRIEIKRHGRASGSLRAFSPWLVDCCSIHYLRSAHCYL